MSLIRTCVYICVYCLSHPRALPVLKIVTLDLRLFAIKVQSCNYTMYIRK